MTKAFSVVQRAPEEWLQEASAGRGLLWAECILRWFRGISARGRACKTAAGVTVVHSLGGSDPAGVSGSLSTVPTGLSPCSPGWPQAARGVLGGSKRSVVTKSNTFL